MRTELEVRLYRESQKESLTEMSRKYRHIRAHVERLQGLGHLPMTKIKWLVKGLGGGLGGVVDNPDPNQLWLPFPKLPKGKDRKSTRLNSSH